MTKMNEEIKSILEKWKTGETNYFNSIRSVRYKSSPIANGEFMIIIQSVLQVADQTISIGRPFFTFAQSNISYIKNKKGDIYRLEMFLKNFDEDFNKEVQNRLTDSVDEKDESGYLDL